MAATDRVREKGWTLVARTTPSTKQFIPTFSDTDELEFVTDKGFILSTSGDIHYESKEGDDITFSFDAGKYDIAIRKIYQSGTTVSESDILCLV